MKDFNQAVLVGNLTRDPELRYTPSNAAVVSFAVATNRQWTTESGEKKEAVDFHEVVVWGKLGELCHQYLSKGRKVLIVGRIHNRSWEAQDGTKRTRTEIVATDVNFLDRRGEGGGEYTAPSPETSAQAPAAKAQETPKEPKGKGKEGEAAAEEEIDIEEIPF